ncbi:MAG: hypothetical protein JWN44_449 [Myxococcales bacterium]|nr:hypothetical protein [Myxococcales bacterium]
MVTGVTDGERLDGVLTLAERSGVPVTLALDAETAVGATRAHPERATRLRAAFEKGTVRPILTTAHGAEAALLGADELADELRLDEETLQALFGVALERRGFCGRADVATLEQAGIDFILDDVDEPCRVGERMIALPAWQFDLNRTSCDQIAGELEAMEQDDIVGAEALAANLTPPWLPEGECDSRAVPPSLAALAELTGWCVDAFGLRRVPGVPAAGLLEEGWRLERFPARARLPLVRRRGLRADRRAWVSAYEVCDVLSVEARVPGLAAHAVAPLSATVLPTLAALCDEHGAGEPMARAAAAYEELRSFRFVGALRWRAFLSSLRDAFALLSSRRSVDWSVTAEEPVEVMPVLRLVEPSAPLN